MLSPGRRTCEMLRPEYRGKKEDKTFSRARGPGGSPNVREQRVCEADREYLFQHFMNRRGVQNWELLNRRGPQNHDQMSPWGPGSEAPITRGMEFAP